MARSITQFAEPNVKYYGAVGDGETDDTTAIAAAIAAAPGHLYFPKGTYLTSGGFTLANPITVKGDGKAGFDGATGVSTVLCNSRTANLFNITAYHAKFEDIGLQNTAAQAPTAGAGITVAGSTLVQRVDYESVSVNGFYNDIDVQVGCSWAMHNCWLYAPVLYGLKIANTQNGDAGDWSISQSNFFCAVRDAGAAIRLESSGGGKISDCKFNKALDSKSFLHGIDVAMGGASTSILIVCNNSFENFRGNAINIDTGGNLDYIIINGNEIHIYNATGYAIVLDAEQSGLLDNVVIANNVLMGSNVQHEAINLVNVNHGKLTGNVFGGFTDLAAQTTCTDIVIA